MGGFYQGRVRQKIISKQHNISGSHKWLTVIVFRSSATQSGNINKKYQKKNFELKNLITGLTQNPGFEKIDFIIRLWMALLEQKLK